MNSLKSFADQANLEFVRYTESASAIFRTLALGGIAIVWLLRPAPEESETLRSFRESLQTDKALFLAFLFFVLALLFDALQYIISCYKWSRYQAVLTRIEHHDDGHSEKPQGPALAAWSTGYGRSLASFLEQEARQASSASWPEVRSDSQSVWFARKLLHENNNSYLTLRERQAVLARLWIPWHVTSFSNAAFWAKLIFAFLGYVLLLASFF